MPDINRISNYPPILGSLVQMEGREVHVVEPSSLYQYDLILVSRYYAVARWFFSGMMRKRLELAGGPLAPYLEDSTRKGCFLGFKHDLIFCGFRQIRMNTDYDQHSWASSRYA